MKFIVIDETEKLSKEQFNFLLKGRKMNKKTKQILTDWDESFNTTMTIFIGCLMAISFIGFLYIIFVIFEWFL